MNLDVKHFNVNIASFKPSEFIPSVQFLTTGSQFTPSTASECNYEDDLGLYETEAAQAGSTKLYKTEMCKNWVESAHCRYGKKCQFAHGHDELAQARAAVGMDSKTRTKNCRTFYKEKVCNYGSRCMFRHEHRHIRQIHRHYYVAKLYTYESLFQYSKDQASFVFSYDNDVSKLSAFTDIHALDDGEEQEPADFDSVKSIQDDSLSFIEMEEEIIAFCDPDTKSPSDIDEQNCSLNTSVSSCQESQRSDSGKKNMVSRADQVFDIAAQKKVRGE